MTPTLRRWWEGFWFRPCSQNGIVAARIILSTHALWIVLSRPDLPDILAWPRPFWALVDRSVLFRFLIFPVPVWLERLLFFTLIVALVATALGLRTRVSAFASALLLYHFAPFEDVFSSAGGPFFRGLTVAVSGLFVLAFSAEPRRAGLESPEYRWPIALIRLLFAMTYLFSGTSKLLSVGPGWATAENFRGLILGLCFPTVKPPWADFFLESTVLCWIGALSGLAMDFGTVAAAVSGRAAKVVVPALFVAHFVVMKAMGVVFLAAPLLLLFVDWENIGRAGRDRVERRTEPAMDSQAVG